MPTYHNRTDVYGSVFLKCHAPKKTPPFEICFCRNLVILGSTGVGAAVSADSLLDILNKTTSNFSAKQNHKKQKSPRRIWQNSRIRSVRAPWCWMPVDFKLHRLGRVLSPEIKCLLFCFVRRTPNTCEWKNRFATVGNFIKKRFCARAWI